jgi:hypothetical protein
MQEPAELVTVIQKRYRCRHIHAAGHQCGSPALRNEHFCYYHHTTRRPAPAAGKFRHLDAAEPFTLPIVEDRTSALLVASQLLSRIASNDLDHTRAGKMLYNLQIITALLPREPRPAPAIPESNAEPVQKLPLVEDLVLDETHGLLAPIAEIPPPEPATNNQQPTILPTLQAVTQPATNNLQPATSSIHPDILIPDLRMVRDIPRNQLPASLRPHIHHLHTILPQPVDPALKRLTLPHNHPLEPKLPDQPRAEPARRERRHHRHLAIAPLPPRLPERIGLAVRAGIVLLHAPVVAGGDQPPVGRKQRRANRDSTLRQPGPRLDQRNFQHFGIAQTSLPSQRLLKS